MDAPRRILYEGDLPECCRQTPWGLPLPSMTSYTMTSTSSHEGWDLGLDRWTLTVHATFFDDLLESIESSIVEHLGDSPPSPDVDGFLQLHGVAWDEVDHGFYEVPWVSEVTVLRARLFNEWSPAAGRMSLRSGSDLLSAADSDSQGLLELVEPLVDLDGGVWSDVVRQIDPDAEECATLVVLEDAVVTPALRGHGLGAWAAASALTQVADGYSLVAARAFPIDRNGAPLADTEDPIDREFDFLQGAERLGKYWSRSLGLTSIPRHPDLLLFNTMKQNPALAAALSAFS